MNILNEFLSKKHALAILIAFSFAISLITPYLFTIIIIPIYFLCIYNFLAPELKQFLKNTENSIITFSLILAPAFLLYIILGYEKYFYFWDSAGYWRTAISLTENFYTQSVFQTITYIFNSINNDEYNILPNLLPSFYLKFTGLNFNNYILSTFLFYVIPFYILFINLLIKNNILNINNRKTVFKIIILISTTTSILIPVRGGFIDVLGLIFILISITLTQKLLENKSINYKNILVIAIILALIVFSRRWYAFWVIGFFPAFGLAYYNYTTSILNYFKNVILKLFYIGITFSIIIIIPFNAFFKRSIFTNYSDLYQAYQTQNFNDHLTALMNFNGLFIIGLMLTGIIISFKNIKNDKNRSLYIYIFIQTLISNLLFTRINIYGYQHNYLTSVFILFFTTIGILFFDSKYKKSTYIVIIIYFLTFYKVFINNSSFSENKLFPKIDNSNVLIRKDYYEIIKITDYVDSLTNSGKKAFLVSSSIALNDALLQNSKLPNSLHALPNLIYTYHVDIRDPFPNQMFFADYIITTDPVQCHLSPDYQSYITYFNHEINDGFFAKKFKLIKQFQLDNNIKVKFLERTHGYDSADINHMYNFFKNKYPDYPHMWNINTITSRIFNKKIGNQTGRIELENENSIFIHPGINTSTEFSLNLNAEFTNLELNLTFRNKNLIPESCTNKDGEVYFQILLDGNEYSNEYIDYNNDKKHSIPVQNIKTITFIVNKGKNEANCDWFMIENIHLIK